MTSSRFGILDGTLDKNYEFKNDIRKHEIDGKSVESHIRFLKTITHNDIEVVSGTVVSFKNIKANKITRNDNDLPYVTKTYTVQPYGIDFFILDKKYIQTEISADLALLMRNVNHSLPSKIGFHDVQIYIEKINEDYPIQWYALEQNNRKHVTTTKVTGNDIVKDDVYGGSRFTNVPKKDIGINGEINDKSVELRISKKGLFQFPQNRQGQYTPTLLEIAEYFVKKMSHYAS